jgi:hypothetical protein
MAPPDTREAIRQLAERLIREDADSAGASACEAANNAFEHGDEEGTAKWKAVAAEVWRLADGESAVRLA